VKVVAINIAPGRRLPMKSVESVQAEAGRGLVGDRYHGTKHRHVSVQSREQLDDAAVDLGHPFHQSATRRNITVDVGEIPTKPGTRARIGAVELEVVRLLAPCRLLDDDMGRGAMAAMRHRGGSALRVLTSGIIRVGDRVEFFGPEPGMPAGKPTGRSTEMGADKQADSSDRAEQDKREIEEASERPPESGADIGPSAQR
jgi:MOSC domain-containing protein YiiM